MEILLHLKTEVNYFHAAVKQTIFSHLVLTTELHWFHLQKKNLKTRCTFSNFHATSRELLLLYEGYDGGLKRHSRVHLSFVYGRLVG